MPARGIAIDKGNRPGPRGASAGCGSKVRRRRLRGNNAASPFKSIGSCWVKASDAMERTITAVSLIFALVGAAGLIGAGVAAVDTMRFLDAALRVTGEVISLEEKLSSQGDLLYRSVFKFKTESGQVVVFRSSSLRSPPAYDVGDLEQIAYLATDPNRARETSFFSLWGDALISGGPWRPLFFDRWRHHLPSACQGCASCGVETRWSADSN